VLREHFILQQMLLAAMDASCLHISKLTRSACVAVAYRRGFCNKGYFRVQRPRSALMLRLRIPYQTGERL
jgi:hypothetical protein